MQAAANRSWINVNLNDPFILHQLAAVSGKVMQRGAKADYAIGLGDQIISCRRRKRAENVDVKWVVVEQAFGAQSGCKRCLQPFRQAHQFVTRVNGPTACQN